LSEVGTAVWGVSTLLEFESATAVEGCQDRFVAIRIVHDTVENLTSFLIAVAVAVAVAFDLQPLVRR